MRAKSHKKQGYVFISIKANPYLLPGKKNKTGQEKQNKAKQVIRSEVFYTVLNKVTDTSKLNFEN